MERLYDLDDIHLIPRVASTLQSRDEVKPHVELFPGVVLTVPIIAAPMMDVCNGAFARLMREAGGFGFIHRFSSIGDQVKEFYSSEKQGGCAIGLGAEGVERFDALRAAGCKYFCLDVANGFAEEVKKALIFYNDTDTYFVVGNVASIQGYKYLNIPVVMGTRISIGTGGGCLTTKATGINHPTASLIQEIERYRNSPFGKLGPLAIADGGINSPDRFCKALALGADCVMMGSSLAVAQESPAQKVNQFEYNNKDTRYRGTYNSGLDSAIFRGSASFEVQKEYREPRYIEGKEVLLSYSGETLEQILNRYMSGLRSSMSYFNARTLEEYRTNVSYGVKA